MGDSEIKQQVANLTTYISWFTQWKDLDKSNLE